MSSITTGGLPRLFLHGFTPPSPGNQVSPNGKSLQDYIDALPPLYEQTKTQGYTKEGLIYDTSAETLLRCDLPNEIELTRFVTELSWEVKTELPYANCGVTLRVPSALASYLLHGRLADMTRLGASVTASSGFKHIEAGGWIVVKLPVDSQSGQAYLKAGLGDLRTVFLGRIQTIEVTNSAEDSGIFSTSIRLTCTSFIHSYTLAEARKTPLRVDAIQQIDPLAITESDSVNNPIVQAINRFDEQEDTSVAVALRFFIQNFGYFELPTSLAGTQGGKPARLGDHIFIMGDTKRTFIQTVYRAQTGTEEIIKGRPAKSALSQAMQNPTVTLWNLLTGLFIPEAEIMELFPTLIPIDNVTGSTRRGVNDEETLGGGGATTQTKEDSFYRITNSKLVRSLGAIPALVYRYKPLPPGFELDKASLNKGYANLGLAENPQETFSAEFYGKSIAEQAEPNGGDVTVTGAADNNYIAIPGDSVIKEVLTWNDSDRVNAVSYAQPYASASGGDLLLFGVDCVPVFNAVDINRNGLRIKTGATPFVPVGNSEQQRIYASIASSATAERVYFTVGEGHAYARGTISLIYTPNPNLTAGVWVKISYSSARNAVPLYAYVHSVSHRVAIDARSGKPSGLTTLNVERASYGNRIPAVQYKQVKLQTAIERPTSQTKQTQRAATRRGG
jgi:hypothetical protein